MLAASDQQGPGAGALSVDVQPARDQVVVVPAGELDLSNAAKLERELSTLQAAGVTDVVLDLRAVTFIDSTGLSLLLRQHHAAQADGHRFRLVEGEPAHRLFEVTGTSDVFDRVRLP